MVAAHAPQMFEVLADPAIYEFENEPPASLEALRERVRLAVRRTATRAEQRIDLTAKEFLLLTLFLRRKGEVLSRTEIAEQVWDMNFDGETNVVEVAVRRLRSKMDAPFERTLLHTVRGMGYILEARSE